jgi:hypothetical protein
VPGLQYQDPAGRQLSLQPVRVRQCKREKVRGTSAPGSLPAGMAVPSPTGSLPRSHTGWLHSRS